MPSWNAWVEPLGWMLIHSVWLIALIVGMSAVGLGLLRHRSANARYLFGCVALLLSLSTLPAVLVWGLTRSVTPDEFGTLISTRSLTVSGGDAVDLDGTGKTVRIDAGPEMEGQPVPLEVSVWRNHDGRLLMDVDSPRPAEAHATSPMELTAWQQAESWLRPHLALLVSGWLAGVCLLSVRPLIGWHSARRLQRVGLSEVSDSLQEMVSRLAGRLGLRRAVKIFQSSLVQIPCVVGALKPVILLSASAIIGLSSEQLEALLAHEIAHIRRHDFAVNVVQTLVETLLFYHPAIWWLSRRVRQEREHCCDDLAISVCGDVTGYARMLVSVEGLRGRVPQSSVAASGGSLVERIRRLLPSPPEQTRSPWMTVVVVLATLMVLVGSWQWTVGQVSNLPVEPEAEVGRALLPIESVPEETGKSARPTSHNKDWPQWGRTSQRNNVAEGRLPLDWDSAKGTNVVWKAKLGSETYSSPIVSGGKVFIGTNNGGELNPAHPKEKDLSCLACFDEATGKLLWQYASEKLPAGRSFDWPNIGLCSTAYADGDRVWVVTNRCEVVCLDANGFRDGENDGPFIDEPAKAEIDADVIWKFDMFGELGVRPLHQAASSITKVDGVLLLNTSNGPDDSYQKAAAPHAPNFLALDATTGRVIWKDNLAGESIVVGGSSCMCSGASPAVATLGGVTQAIFTGKEGWVYGYDFNDLKLGKTTLLWKFDCNPKTAIYTLGGRSRRYPLVAAPIVAEDRVYVATGRNPERGEGEADLWCIDPTKRGDLSSELVFNKSFENGEQPIPHKTLRACETDKGDFVRPNPNSGVIWHYAKADRNGNGKVEFDETFHSTMGSPVIHDGLLFIADFSGMMHCLDSKTGEVQWTHDLLSAVYATCVVADGHVLIGDEDGELEIFKVARTKQSVFGDTPQNFDSSIYGTPVLVNGTLFVASKNSLVAIRDPKQVAIKEADALGTGLPTPALGAGLLTPPKTPTEGLPNVAQPRSTNSTDANEETSGPTQRRGQETRAEREVVTAVDPASDVEANPKPKRSPNPLVSLLQPAPAKALLDAAGEVMPIGMTQRLGSTRFKVPGWWRRLAFAGNDEWVWLKADGRVSVIHRETGRVVKHHQLRLGEEHVQSLTSSADGTRVAIGMFEFPPDAEGQTNYRVVVMSALTTAHLQELKWKALPSDLNCLSFSGDGQTLLTGTQRGDVRLWDVETGKQLRQQAFEEGADLRDAALSPDGRSAVLGGWRMSFLWNLADNAGPIKLAKNRGDSVSFAPNSRLFSTIGRDGPRLWNAENGELIAHLKSKEIQSYGDSDFGIAFTPDSKVLAVPAVSGDLVELWNVETKQRVATLPVHQPRGVAISRDGRWLAAAGQESITAIFDLKTRQQVSQPGDGHSQEVSSVRFAGNDSLVSSSGGDPRVWDLKTGKQQQTLAHDNKATVRGLAASPDSSLIVTSGFDDTLGVWERATGKRLHTLKGHGHFGGSRAVQFQTDGRQFVSWGDDAVLRWWNAKDGTLLKALTLDVPSYKYGEDGADVLQSFSLNAALAPDANSLFVSFDGLFEFDTRTGQRRRRVPSNRSVVSTAISPDGRWLATAEREKDRTSTIVLRDRTTLEVVREWLVRDPQDAAATAESRATTRFSATGGSGMGFSPDSKHLAWLRDGARPAIDIVEVTHDRLHASIPVESPCWCLDFSSDGKQLASGHADSTISVWDCLQPAFVVGRVLLREPQTADDAKALVAPPANDSMHTGRVSGTIRVAGQVPVMLPTARWPAGGFHSELQRREWSITEQRRPTKAWDDSLLVSKEQGLSNAVVYLRTAPKGFVPEPPPSEPFVLTNETSMFSPRVAVMRTGQPVVLKNDDSQSINLRSNPLRSDPFNVTLGRGDSFVFKAGFHKHPERLPISIVSDFEFWKRAFVLPLDHPFAAVTDSAGRFEISGLPPGEHDFIAWHERTGYLEKKLTVTVKEDETTNVPPLSYELARFNPEQLLNGVAAWWADGGDGWSVGVGWSSGNTEFVFDKPDRSDAVTFQLSLRNNTDQPLTVPVPESLTWDFGMEDHHQLNVRIHDRGQTKLTLKPREVRVLDVPKPTLDLTDIEPGFWSVRFNTPFNRQGSLDLWLDAPQPRWLTRQVRVLRAVVKHPDDEFQNVLWGESLQGLRLGVRVKSNPADAVRIEPSPPPRSTFRLIWPENQTVKLVPEFFLWNATDADVAISMLHHTPQDWVHRIVQEAGAMRRTAPRGNPEVGPAPLVTGPKFDEPHRLTPGAVLRLGESALQVVPPDSKTELDHQTAKLPADEYGYWTFLNLHRTDQPHVSLHLQSGLQRLLIEAAK